MIGSFKNLQIQYHDFVPGAVGLRDAISKKLRKTHFLTYCFDFIWENWQLRPTVHEQSRDTTDRVFSFLDKNIELQRIFATENERMSQELAVKENSLKSEAAAILAISARLETAEKKLADRSFWGRIRLLKSALRPW